MSKKIQSFLIARYPTADHVFSAFVIPRLRPRDMHLADAVVRVVVGQMLSAQAARTIFCRLSSLASQRQVGTWELSPKQLRSCGLSIAKTRTISEFGYALRRAPTMLDEWRSMDAEQLIGTINGFWGMSDWTASILALFYLGHEDVFPIGDGSLMRALQYLARTPRERHSTLDPERARPYRSYLALYL